MSNPPRLGEVLAAQQETGKFEDWGGEVGRALAKQLEASLHGIEVPCPVCGGFDSWGPEYNTPRNCPVCHDTGTIREGGLVERVEARLKDVEGGADFHDGIDATLEALRLELRETLDDGLCPDCGEAWGTDCLHRSFEGDTR